MLTELRVRSRISPEALDSRKEKILTERDYDVLLTGPTRVLAPDGRPLCVYLPRAVVEEMTAAYPVLHTIREVSYNRGAASGTPGSARFQKGNMQRSKRVHSSILGSFEASGYYKFCRLTSWTARQMDTKWPELLPLWKGIAAHFETYVPDRYRAQMSYAGSTAPEWMIAGTPFTTITVNNTFSTGVHQDKGDLDEGFSCLAVARRGEYEGGCLTFPEFRLAADMRDGDLILMDAHQWHGNTQIVCKCRNVLSDGPCPECNAERVSTVCYFRTKMVGCGTAKEEGDRALAWAETKNIAS